MKYMTFNSSCAYAGVANMLAQYGVETDDRAIALEMRLPYLFAREGDAFLSGPMLQSARWFDLYLRPRGFRLVETPVAASDVAAYLRGQKAAMLGVHVEGGKHAIVYTGCQGDALIFLNNKHAEDTAPAAFRFTPDELSRRIDPVTMVATLAPTPPEKADFTGLFDQSVRALRENVAAIRHLSEQPVSPAGLRAQLNPLFRPLLLDGVTMLTLLGEEGLAARFTALQRVLLTTLRQASSEAIRLADHLPMEELSAAAEAYVRLIRQADITSNEVKTCSAT